MQVVWLVRLMTTGQTWHTAVAKNRTAVDKIFKAHGLDVTTTDILPGVTATSSQDPSQSAVAYPLSVVE